MQTRAFPRNNAGKRQAIFYGTWDVSLSLMIAFFVNAAILITAAGAMQSSRQSTIFKTCMSMCLSVHAQCKRMCKLGML